MSGNADRLAENYIGATIQWKLMNGLGREMNFLSSKEIFLDLYQIYRIEILVCGPELTTSSVVVSGKCLV